MHELFQNIRRRCSHANWSRASQLVRKGAVEPLRSDDSVAEYAVRARGGRDTANATLFFTEGDWSCECPSSEEVCTHVAAASIAWNRMVETRNAAIAEAKPGHIGYRLSRVEGRLAIKRVVVQGKREVPLNSLMAEAQQQDGIPQFIASPADRQIEALLGPANGAIPQNLMFKTLDALSAATDIQYAGRPAKIGAPAAGICVRVEECGLGFRMRLDQDPLINEVFHNGALRRGIKIIAVVPHSLGERMFNQLRTGKIYERDEIGTLVSEILPKLELQVPVHIDTTKLPKRALLRPRVSITTTNEPGDQLGLLADIVYGDPPRARVEGEGLALIGDAAAPVRDVPAEQKLARELHMTLELRPGEKRIFNEMKAINFATRLMHVPPEEVSIIGDAHQRFFDVGMLEPEINVTRTGDVEMFFGAMDRTGSKMGAGRGVDAAVLLRAWQSGASMVPLVDGGFARLPMDWLAKYGHRIRDFMAAREAMEADGRKAPKEMRYALSAALLKALDKPVPPKFDRLRTIIEDFEGIPHARLPKLGGNVKLRDYQRQGVDWLSFLRDAELGALLADDMGLGKTLQTICTIKGRTLVVAPTSVLHNWETELKRFRPNLKVNRYHGPDRELDAKADVTLTTYAILRLDEEKLSAEEWDMAVLDEAQSIKNATSQVAKAAFALNALFRVALTGTPVENRLEDLWSQFHFVNRGLLGGRQDFYERYVKPISSGDEEAGKRLRERVRPFVLRRMKAEVAKELPPRTEVVLKCELSKEERDVYDAVKATTQKEVVQKLASGASTLAVLEALLRLRQAACHPGLLPGQSKLAEGSSAKVTLLRETLEEAIAEDHKALVFSQWTSLLDLIENELNNAKIAYVRLDGTTKDRKSVVDTFQANDGPKVMLVSLKAGGTGLNLTSADHVFMVDPWWNPAVEDQAADRAHRIGQTRPVIVHRLVSEDTVEERILALQLKKRELAEAAIGSGKAVASEVTKEELLALLK